MGWHALIMDPLTREVWVTSVGEPTRQAIEEYAAGFHGPVIGYVDLPMFDGDDETPITYMRHYVPEYIKVPGTYSNETGLTAS